MLSIRASIVIHNVERSCQSLLRLMNSFKQLMEMSMKINSQSIDLAPPHVKQSMKFYNIFLQI